MSTAATTLTTGATMRTMLATVTSAETRAPRVRKNKIAWCKDATARQAALDSILAECSAPDGLADADQRTLFDGCEWDALND